MNLVEIKNIKLEMNSILKQLLYEQQSMLINNQMLEITFETLTVTI